MTHVVADFAAAIGGFFLHLLDLLSGKVLTGGVMGRQDAEPEAELVCQKVITLCFLLVPSGLSLGLKIGTVGQLQRAKFYLRLCLKMSAFGRYRGSLGRTCKSRRIHRFLWCRRRHRRK